MVLVNSVSERTSSIEISGGYEWSTKARVYAQQQFSVGSFGVESPSVLQGPLGEVFSDTNILNPANNFVFGVPGANNQSYFAATMTDAVFGKVDWTFDDTWRFMLGFRWEDYRQVALDWNINGYTIENPQVTTDPETLANAAFQDDKVYPSFALTYMTELWAEIFQLGSVTARPLFALILGKLLILVTSTPLLTRLSSESLG